MRLFFVFMITVSVLSGCSVLTCPNCYEGGEEADASATDVVDGGPDLNEPDVRSACDSSCVAPQPFCVEQTASCVACLEDDHCPGDEECADGVCRECMDSSECTSAEAPVCADSGPELGRCVPCVDSGGCNDIEADGVELSICHEPAGEPNVCVECDGADQCGPFVCDVRAQECSDERLGMADVCAGCVSSAQCQPGSVCAQEVFGGVATGFYCFPLPVDKVCTVSRVRRRDTWETVEGGSIEVCHPGGTTCQGLLDDTAPCEEESTCGLSGVDDSACVDSECTHLCAGVADCRSGEACSLTRFVCE